MRDTGRLRRSIDDRNLPTIPEAKEAQKQKRLEVQQKGNAAFDQQKALEPRPRLSQAEVEELRKVVAERQVRPEPARLLLQAPELVGHAIGRADHRDATVVQEVDDGIRIVGVLGHERHTVAPELREVAVEVGHAGAHVAAA